MNAYLHIPFCTSICNYCDFTSFAGMEGRLGPYVDALAKEIENSDLKGPLATVYFGGGTPSLLPPARLEWVLKALRDKAGFAPDAEISMEANPETVDGDRLKGYRDLGVNRLSFGAQAAQKELLRKMGRGHEWDRVEKAFGQARSAGFGNINLDLMFGLSGQTLEMFQNSIEKTLALGPDHLSLYALQVEPGTPLAQAVAEGLPLPSEDLVADEYALAQKFLAEKGYEQYEVSNFAKPGFHCRHNLNIWQGEDYWGFGLSAVGTVGPLRHGHGEDLEGYIGRVGRGEPVLEVEELSPKTRAWERIMLGLRTRSGVPKGPLTQYLGAQAGSRLRPLLGAGLLVEEGERVRVAPQGYFVLNGILEKLVV
ncbi:MAG TPA: radical SAM family heme chaperone HemW [bacterium]|nr:radical SAM family heme chaperone HemW [bacterium]